MQIAAQRRPLLSGFLFLVPVVLLPIFVITYDFKDFDQERSVFFVLNLILVSYIFFEVARVTVRETWLTLAQPPVLTSLVFFGKDFFLPNSTVLLGLGNPIAERFLTPIGNELYWLNWATFGSLLALSALWIGYNLTLSRYIADHVRHFLQKMNLIRGEFRMNLMVAIGLGALSVVSVLLQIRLGIYGYSADPESIQRYNSATAWLNILRHGGSLSLLVLTMAYFTLGRERSLVLSAAFFTVLGWEFLAGFMSGFKSQVVWPVIMVGFGYYFVRRRLSLITLVLFPVMLIVAFQVIDGFRVARWISPSFDGTSVGSITSTLWEASSTDRYSRYRRNINSFEAMATRTDLITFTARAIAYADDNANSEKLPPFATDLVLIPFNAFIPRFIWSSKAIVNDGYWFNVEVLKASPQDTTAVGMGPISYLYFVGGMFAVWVGFFILGIAQRIAFSALMPLGIGGWIIYLGMLNVLAIPISNVSAGIGGLLRMLPFLILAQMLILKRSKT